MSQESETPSSSLAARARTTGATCFVCTVTLAIVAALFFWGVTVDAAFLGAAVVSSVLAVLMFLLGAIAVPLPRLRPAALATRRAVRILTLVVLGVGIGGGGVALLLAGLRGSVIGMLSAGALMLMSLLLANVAGSVGGVLVRRGPDA